MSECPYTIPVVAVKEPASAKMEKPFKDSFGKVRCVTTKRSNARQKPNKYWAEMASADVKPACIASFTIVDKIPKLLAAMIMSSG